MAGGKLVYWLPKTPEYCAEDLPTHPGLRLLFKLRGTINHENESAHDYNDLSIG